MADKIVKKYFENMPYGDKSKVSEIHGKKNQEVINNFVSSLVRNYDQAMADGDKIRAGKFYGAVTKIKSDLETLKGIKEEFAMNYGGGVGGKNLYSNYTDLTWDRAFWTEQGDLSFDEGMNILLTVKDQSGKDVTKKIEDITENWVIKGNGENTYMTMQQDAVKQRNTVNKPLDFDVDYAVSNLLAENDNWKSFVSDKIGGRYFLQDYMNNNTDMLMNMGASAESILQLDSFNPEIDNRLHEYFANRIRKSFDPDFQTKAEQEEADKLIDKNKQNSTEENNNVVNNKNKNTK
tara:strand:+ start:101 stop:976 length:876 start_codon:yes stop_codon:yes gene_type:complete